MHKHERDTVRQVLETALRNLGADARDGEAISQPVALTGDRLLSSEGQNVAAPVILILAGELSGRAKDSTEPRPESFGDTDERAQTDSIVSDCSKKKVSHPGLERFTMVQAESDPTVPKACFMEPARACVHSGACEMRGF